VERSNGRAVDLWGCEDHPITQGKLCGKVDRYLERTYHRDRLLTPLRRNGPKGSARFVPVGWDEALSDIAARLQTIVSEFGSEAVLPYSYSGTLGLLQGEGMASRFFNRLGASKLARTICSEAGFEGFVYTIGATEGLEMESFAQARLILIWGSNTLTSNLHLWPFINDARKQGARVIVIDPLRTRTAQAADEWLPIRPGTDSALALAMMHVIIGEKLYDADYVAAYTVGFDQLAERVLEWPPERAAAVTGIPAERISSLAREYATIQPAAIRINYGMQRHYGGGMAMRTAACLPALVGAWRYEGGGIQLSASGYFRHLDRTTLNRPDLLANSDWARNAPPGRSTPRTINMNRLGDALSLDPARLALAHYHPHPIDPIPSVEEAGPPVKALIVYNANPAAVTPNQAAVVEGLVRSDLFTVVLEHFQTDTADWADYVLPATTQLEHWDLHKSYGHTYLALNRPAIAPVGHSLSNSEIFRRLATALGFDEPCFRESDEEILAALVDSQTHPRFAGITWERLLAEGFVRLSLPQPNLPFAQGSFPTPSGKCEFYSERMVQDGYDPLPTYHPPKWQSESKSRQIGATSNGKSALNAKAPPLVCISPPAHSFLNSTFVNVERFQRREGEAVVHIHLQDAALRGIRDGDTVEVRNEFGSVRLSARVSDGVVPGTVAAAGVWWAKLSRDGRNINRVTSPEEADMGAGAIFYDAAVEVMACVNATEQMAPTPSRRARSARGADIQRV
jgi:anaerobic selenocysteine-containing dehydrogenase